MLPRAMPYLRAFRCFPGGSPFPEGLVLPDDAQTAAPPSFADFALGVYPFLELEPFHRAYYRVLEAFAAGASGG